MGVLVEVSPPSPHGVGSDVIVLAVSCLDIELDVNIIHPRDVPLGPRTVLPLYLVGGDPSIQIELVHISTKSGIPSAFAQSHRSSLDLPARGLGLDVVGDHIVTGTGDGYIAPTDT